MLYVVFRAPQRRESVLLPTMRTSALLVILELALVLEGILTTPTRVVTKQNTHLITENNTSREWGTSWCSDKENNDSRCQIYGANERTMLTGNNALA